MWQWRGCLGYRCHESPVDCNDDHGAVLCWFTDAFATGTDKSAVSGAMDLLALIDRGKYAERRKHSSIGFRGAVSEQNRVFSLDGLRKPLSILVRREMVTAQESTGFPERRKAGMWL
jgi:hypothetical protein